MPRTVTIAASALASALAAVKPAINTRNTIPILSAVLLTVTDNGDIAVVATDMDVRIAAPAVPATFDPPAPPAGPFAVLPFAALAAFVKPLARKPEPVTITLPDTPAGDHPLPVTVATANGYRATLAPFPTDDYPLAAFRPGDTFNTLAVPFHPLADALAALTPFICTEETRFYLNGVRVEPSPDGALTLTATNGKTLARVTVTPGAPAPAFPPFTMSASMVKAFLAAVAPLRKRDAPLSLVWREDGAPDGRYVGHVGLTIDGVVNVSGERVDGHYPDVDRVTPNAATPLRATVAPDALAALASAVKGFPKSRPGAVSLTLNPGSDASAVMATAYAPDEPAATAAPVPVALPSDAAEPYVVGFTADYFRHVAAFFATLAPSARVTVQQDSPSTPVLFEPADGSGRDALGRPRFVTVVMPRRI